MEGASFIDTAFDPEQAGIVCDRLAMELERAAHANPEALRTLRLDARDLLACTSAWLDGHQPGRVPTFPEEAYDAPARLAAGLRQLADYLLELAEAARMEPSHGE